MLKLAMLLSEIFSVLKKRWDILNRPPQYDISIQARIPAGLAATHNFIVDHDDTDIGHYLQDIDIHEHAQPFGDLGHGAIPRAESERATALRDCIATEMWVSYQQFLQDHPEMLDQELAPEDM
ncbi:hypothetical protein EDB89DRAFT_2069635 [Lactarius sanguifluus]|nr:hypothetical protein EDB89DRAFT_2069635 [Lactarius sanguifluus]